MSGFYVDDDMIKKYKMDKLKEKRMTKPKYRLKGLANMTWVLRSYVERKLNKELKEFMTEIDKEEVVISPISGTPMLGIIAKEKVIDLIKKHFGG